MSPRVARSLDAAAKEHGVRVLLARRPGWKAIDGPRHVFLAHTSPTHRWLERLHVGDIGELADLDLGVLDGQDAPRIGTAHDRELFLVCTNGRHDPCCADLGRPVVRALAEAGVDDVWETTHVGGDRFAANVVCLPTGVYLGRVTAGDAARVLEEVARGSIPLENYRGRCCYPPIVQAAEIFLRHALDERRVEALRLRVSARPSDAEVVVHARVDDGRRFLVHVARTAATQAALTCTSAAPSAPWSYTLVEIRVEDR